MVRYGHVQDEEVCYDNNLCLCANLDRRTERRRERRAAESSEQRETRLARRRVADRAGLS